MTEHLTLARAVRDVLVLVLGVPLALLLVLASCITADGLTRKDLGARPPVPVEAPAQGGAQVGMGPSGVPFVIVPKSPRAPRGESLYQPE